MLARPSLLPLRACVRMCMCGGGGEGGRGDESESERGKVREDESGREGK